jgi:shikimate dehydrogenase
MKLALASAAMFIASMPPLTARARLAGVIGWPVAHSRSPLLHNHWLKQHGIDGAYVPLPVRPELLPIAVAGLRAAGFAGANVTIPHKEAVAALCDTLTPAARRAGAVNTLVFGDDGIRGDNTDGTGFLANLHDHGVSPGPTLLLGAGGAARPIAAALLDAGAPVVVMNRTRARAEALAQALPGLVVADWEDWGALAHQALLVNTTSLGMAGQPPLTLDLSRAPAGLVVGDIVYVPLETPLLAAARGHGLRTVGGLGMLLHQARAGFAAWFGVEPVVDQALHDLVAATL